MIRVLLVKLLDDKKFAENRKIKIDEVAKKSGVGRATLTRIANDPNYSVGLNVIDKLCEYFDCDVTDILQRVPSQADIKETADVNSNVEK